MSKNENKDDLLSKKHEHNSSNNKQHISSENFDGKEFTLVDPSGTSHKAILFIENKRGQKYEEEEVETLPYSPYKTQLPPTFMAPSLTFPPTGIPTGVPPIGVPSTGFIPTNIQLPDQPIQQSLTVQPNISQNETADRSAIIALQQQIPGLTPNEAMATIQQYQQQGIPPE
ncbi:14224_t:CDS:2, partial [Dentiscutata erythropus]